jgi:putative ABC transport system permease protein
MGMLLMVDSFRTATFQWLDQRIVAETYLYGSGSELSKIQEKLNSEGVVTVPRYRKTGKLQLDHSAPPISLHSYPDSPDYQRALVTQQIATDAWSAFAGRKAIFINQQLGYRQNVKLNDWLELELNGEVQKLQVKAIYMDYGNPGIQALLPIDFLRELAPMRSLSIHGNNSEETAENLTNDLIDEVDLLTKKDILAISMQAFDKTFVITNALNIITLLVAVFSLITSILLLEQKNIYIAALLRSLGISRLQVTFSLVLQYGFICLIAAIWAIPFGIVFSWLLVDQLNIQAFQWSFPLLININEIAYAVLLSLVIVILLSALPLIRSPNTSLSQVLSCKD